MKLGGFMVILVILLDDFVGPDLDHLRSGGFLPWAPDRLANRPTRKALQINSFTSWWFQVFCIFTRTWGNDPIWLIFFKWAETTNNFAFFKRLPPKKATDTWVLLPVLLPAPPTPASLAEDRRPQGEFLKATKGGWWRRSNLVNVAWRCLNQTISFRGHCFYSNTSKYTKIDACMYKWKHLIECIHWILFRSLKMESSLGSMYHTYVRAFKCESWRLLNATRSQKPSIWGWFKIHIHLKKINIAPAKWLPGIENNFISNHHFQISS